MANEFMWTYLIHLSNHVWDDPLSPARGPYLNPAWKDTNGTDLKVWDQVIQALGEFKFNTLIIDVGDALQYDSHPEVSAPDAWSKDFMKQKLSEIRALGITPIPKLNFSTCHDAWLKEYGNMISTPIYYQVCADLIREVCEVFDYPKYFHLGMDEEVDRMQAYNGISVVRHTKMWVHDLHFLVAECEKHGARPMTWGGMIKVHREAFEKEITRDIIVCTGFYGRFLHPWEKPNYKEDPGSFYGPDLYKIYEQLGYDQIPTCSTWSYKQNQHQMLGFAKNEMNPEQLKGIMTAPWLVTKPWLRYGLLHDAEKFYYARNTWYPETL